MPLPPSAYVEYLKRSTMRTADAANTVDAANIADAATTADAANTANQS